MSAPPAARRSRIVVGICVQPIAGEIVAGDAALELPWSRGVLLALVDGLGHGARAAAAAEAFLACVRVHGELPLDAFFVAAHAELRKTRGAVAALARFDEDNEQVEFGGVGNVTALLSRADTRHATHAITTAGVLGSAFRAVRPQVFPFAVGDVFVMHSDGVRSHFETKLLRAGPPQAAAQAIVGAHGKASDDASCAMARAVGHTEAFAGAPASKAPPGAGDREIPLRIAGDAQCAAQEARAFAEREGFGARAQWEISIAAAELATNVLKFAAEGRLRLRMALEPREALVLEVFDRGRGIPHVGAAVADGFSEGGPLSPDRVRREGQGLGVGLGSVHRMMDLVDIQSDPERGTRIVATKFRSTSR